MITGEKAKMLGVLRKAYNVAFERLQEPPVVVHVDCQGGFKVETVDLIPTRDVMNMLEEMIEMIESEQTKTFFEVGL